MTEPWRVLVLAPIDEAQARRMLGDGAWDLTLLADRTQEGVYAAAPGTEIVIGDWSHHLRVDAEFVRRAPTLAFVQHPSAGTETSDLDVLAAHGIPVANTGDANTVAVAEWCVLAALVLLRSAADAHDAVRDGGWPQQQMPLRELCGARVGILGMGRIGVATAERFAALGAVVSYWSRSRKPALPYEFLELRDLLEASDVVVAVLPSTDETRSLFDAELLALLSPRSLLVNAGRGDLIDEGALLDALQSGALGGAALDVFATEPLPADSPLRAAPRMFLSPHQAGGTQQAVSRIFGNVTANMQRVARGEAVHDVVNGADPQVQRRSPDA